MILFNKRILRRCQNSNQRVLIQIGQGRNHWQTADKFRDQTVLQQILWFQILKHFANTTIIVFLDVRSKAHTRAFATLTDNLIKACKGAATDKQDIRCVDLQEFLLRMFTATLWWNRCNCPFHNFQQRLLYPLARNVTGNRWVIGLARDLIDLINIDDTTLRAFDIIFRCLQKLQNYIFDIFPHITSFGQGGGICHSKRHIQNAGQCLGQQCLTATSRSDQHDVGFRQLDIRFIGVVQALVMVMDSDRQHAFGVHLTDHIVIKNLTNLGWSRNTITGFQTSRFGFFTNNVHAQLNAFITDEHCWPGNQLTHLMLALAAKAAIKSVLTVATR